MGIVSSVTDEEDDLPCGQHTMCSTNNMWTSDGSTQPNRKSESINFNQFFSGIQSNCIRHLVCFYHVTFVWSLIYFCCSSDCHPRLFISTQLINLNEFDFLSFAGSHMVTTAWGDDLRKKTKTASWHQSSWSVRTATPTRGEPRRRKKIACCTQEDWIQHHLEVREDLVVEGMFSFSF